MAQGYITEIYPTVQGEGLFTGERQVFVRLAGCPLRCDYCDTPDSLSAEKKIGVTPIDAAEKIRRLCWQNDINEVSVTGGEPLVQADFLKELLPLLKENGFSIHLETAGIHYEALEQVVKFCDVIAMDIKLPSATKKSYWPEHKKFLEIGGEKIFVKVVLEKKSTAEEIKVAINLLAEIPKPPVLIFQIVTPNGNGVLAPDRHEVNGYVQAAKERLPEVMLMTQKHKEWGIP